VEYCKGAADTAWGRRRAARGHAAPWNVRWWFVGNEVYSFGRGGVKDPTIHAERSRVFAEAMHAVDLSIRLVPASLEIGERMLRSSAETLPIVAGRVAVALPPASISRVRLE